MNRASRRSVIFGVDEDYRIFEDVLIEATRIHSMRLCDFTIMPNHWIGIPMSSAPTWTYGRPNAEVPADMRAKADMRP